MASVLRINKMGKLLLVLLSFLGTVSASFNVVGWFVGESGQNFTIDKLRWDIYSTIRSPVGIKVSPTGEASCPEADPFFNQIRALAIREGKQLTLSPGIDAWKCFANPNDPNITAVCDRYIETIGAAVRGCGPLTGLEYDYEGHTKAQKAGFVLPSEAKAFSEWMDRIQKAMGGNYTVGADVGVWGFDGIWHKADSYPLGFLPWVNAGVFKANKNLFINTMSYHTPEDCSIKHWENDGLTAHKIWGIPKEQINLGLGYYTFTKASDGPVWATLSKSCPNVPVTQCHCAGYAFTSKQMNFEIGQLVKMEGYRGVFPWAANYDAYDNNNTLVEFIGRGLGIVP